MTIQKRSPPVITVRQNIFLCSLCCISVITVHVYRSVVSFSWLSVHGMSMFTNVCVCRVCACVHVVMQHNQVVTLLQSTQLYKWGPDGLVYWESSPTSYNINGYQALGINWGSKCPTVLVLFSRVKLLWNFGLCDLYL